MEPWRTAIVESRDGHISIRGYDVTSLMTGRTFTDTIYLLHRGRLPTGEERAVLDAILTGVADHGSGAPSCAAARIAISGNRQSVSSAVAAGILAVGDEHGGAGSGCMEMIAAGVERAKRESLSLAECARQVVSETRAAGRRVAGLGHRVHTRDPRTPVLFDLARRSGLAGDGVAFMAALESVVRETIKPLPINIDGALAAVLHDMGFAPAFGRLLFIIGRVAGLSAEVSEELERERPMRIRVPVQYKTARPHVRSTEAATELTAQLPRTRQRWFPILALVAVATMVNYLDRTVLGIAAPYLTKELGLTAASLGIVFSAFSWSYALLQIPGGVFLDRFGTRVTYTLSLTLWSAFTALMGFVNGLPMLILTRIGVGVFEAPCFPANSRILATWFPQHERARANSVYSVGQYAGIAFLSVPLFWITQQFGWRQLFFIAGGFGIALGALFWWRYREPSQSATINVAELAHIEIGGGGEYKGARVAFSWKNIGRLLRHRQILGASIGQFGGNSTQVFFVTWFPTYLVNARGMSFINAGMMTMLPYIGASVGVLVAGQFSDRLLKRTGSANLARKLPIVGGMLLASTIVAANFVPAGSDLLVVAIMSVAFFGQGMTNLGWTVISDVAPKKLIGLTAGIFNFSANLAGIITPLVVGYAYQTTGSFVGPLIYIGAVALLGAFAYSVILGDIHRLDEDL